MRRPARASTGVLIGARRILVSRLRFLGDLVLVTPLLRALRELAPELIIGFLAEDRYGGILTGHPDIDRLYLLRTGAGTQIPDGMKWPELVRVLRKERFDIVLDLFANPRSALLARACGAPVRVGGDHGLRGRLFTHHPRREPRDRTAVDHHLAHLRPLGVADPRRSSPRLYLASAERGRARERLHGLLGSDRGPLVGIHPGASWAPKRWPVGRFAAVAELLAARWDARFLVTYGPGEEEGAASLARELGGRSALLRPVPWRELAAVLSLCDLYLSNDCGPMHVAAAVGTPTVGIFGPSDPQVWFPYPPEEGHRAVEIELSCRPCPGRKCADPQCILKVTPEMVLAAAAAALRKTAGTSPGRSPRTEAGRAVE